MDLPEFNIFFFLKKDRTNTRSLDNLALIDYKPYYCVDSLYIFVTFALQQTIIEVEVSILITTVLDRYFWKLGTPL